MKPWSFVSLLDAGVILLKARSRIGLGTLNVIIKHWYCDGTKPITRKEFYLYEDKACTKLIKTWSVEAPVGVQ